MKNIIIKYFFMTFIILLSSNQYIYAQLNSIKIGQPVALPVHIVEKRIYQEEKGGKKYDIYLKDSKSGSILPYEYEITGTGFIIKDSLDLFLVTAKHVAEITSNKTIIKYSVDSSKANELTLKNMVYTPDSLKWSNHSTADLSIIKLNNTHNSNLIKNIVPTDLIEFNMDIPPYDSEVYIIGYPLGLGASSIISPITKISKVSSSLFQLSKDAGRVFLLDDPSVGGFSGSPVWLLGNQTIGGTKYPKKLVGIVSANLSDNSKIGGLAVIVPTYYIKELLDKY